MRNEVWVTQQSKECQLAEVLIEGEENITWVVEEETRIILGSHDKI